MKFNDYCKKRLLQENDGYTDSLAANMYHDDEDVLQQIAQTSPKAHKRFSRELGQIQQAQKVAGEKLEQARKQVELYTGELERLKSQHTSVRFKLSQYATERGLGVRGPSKPAAPVTSVSNDTLDKLPSTTGTPSDAAPFTDDSTEPRRKPGEHEYEKLMAPHLANTKGGQHSWWDMGRWGAKRRPSTPLN